MYKENRQEIMVFKDYARYYDIIYKKKAYQKECVFIEELFKEFSPRELKTILDLGCGTGNHIVPFLESGYRVTGMDASKEMLSRAKDKIKEKGFKVNFINARLQNIKVDKKFDLVTCLFSVIDYLTDEKDLNDMLRSVKGALKKESLFVFDFWQAQAVEKYYSPSKAQRYSHRGIVFERNSRSRLFKRRKLCQVNYSCRVKEKGAIVAKFKEKHVMRYFHVEEMIDYVEKAGMKVVFCCPFMNPKGKIRANTWDVTMVACLQ